MVELNFTVKGLFALADDYEREALGIRARGEIEAWHWLDDYGAAKVMAARCRTKAYKMLGVSTVDENQKHMGEVMADF